MEARELVAWNLRKLRVRAGISQEKLAVDAGLDRTYISGLERAVENPTVAVLDRLAGALGTPVSAFFKEPPPKARPPLPLRGGRKPAQNYPRARK
jgi:transcriptional regulator with XRE-family HTH domain